MSLKDRFLALLVVTIWGLAFVAIKVGLKDFPPLLLCGLRFALAAVPAVFFIRRPNIAWSTLCLYALVMYAGQFALLFTGMRLGMSAGLSSLALQLHVFITIALAALWLREQVTWTQVLGTSLAFAGIVVIGLNVGGEITIVGLLFVVAAATAWACGNLMTKRMQVDNVFGLVVWSSLLVPIPMFSASLILEGPAIIAQSFAKASWLSWACVAYMVYPTTLLGFAIWNRLIGRYSAATVAPLTLLVPVVGLLSSALLLNEPLTSWKLLAAACVLGGLSVNMFGTRLVRLLVRDG